MDANTSQFYDLLSRAFGGTPTAKRLQDFIDRFNEKYNVAQWDGFKFAPDMQLDFTFEQVQKELGIVAMANYYDVDSPAIPRAGEELTLSTGKIPRMKDAIYFNEDKVRKQLIFEAMMAARSNGSDLIRNNAKSKLFTTVDDLIAGHTNSLTYQRMQVVSTGEFSINSANNPKGISGITLKFGVPNGNKTTISDSSKKWWTAADYSAEGVNSDPVTDLLDFVQPIAYKGYPFHLEVELGYFRRILNHSKVVAKIGAALFPNSPSQASSAAIVGYEGKKRALEDILGVSIKTFDAVAAVEKYNKTTKSIEKTNAKSFEPNVIVAVPDGTIGEILTVMPIKVADPAAKFADFYGGRLLLTVTYDASKKCQAYESEMTSLFVPEMPKNMFYLYPNNA